MTPLSLATIEESEKKIDFGGWDDFPKQQLQQQLSYVKVDRNFNQESKLDFN